MGSISVSADNHQPKLGADLRQLSPVFAVNKYRMSITFSNLSAVRDGMASLLDAFAQQVTRPRFLNLSLFAQDTWKASSRLTLTYGLRWELNPPPHERDGNEALTLTGLDNPAAFAAAPRGTPLYRTSYTSFAPRFGVAYQVTRGQGRELVLRGGVGKFYALGSEAISRAYIGYPFTVTKSTSNASLPFTATQLEPPPFPTTFAPPFPGFLYVYEPDIKLPETWQWNVALE